VEVLLEPEADETLSDFERARTRWGHGQRAGQEEAMKKLLLAIGLAATLMVMGTAIAQDAPDTPYFVVEGEAVGQDFVGLVPEGLRIDGHTRGVVTDGLFAGATMSGIDYLLFRHDGVGVIDARWLLVDADGATVAITLKGYIGEPSPGFLEAFLDPEFEPVDVDIPSHGAAWFQTMAPQYAFLNHTVFGFTGSLNIAQGVIRLTGRPLAR
jgi:hypothetical protein